MRGGRTEKNAHLWERHPQDFYVDPDWCSRRLFDEERFHGWRHDPFCGGMSIVRASLLDSKSKITFSDIAPPEARGKPENTWHPRDYLADSHTYRNIVSNPPFSLCDPRKDKSKCCIRHALAHTIHKVAFLIPTKWMNAAGRGAWLETTPLRRVYLLGPRPSMPPGPVVMAGLKPGNGMTDFAWFVWLHGYDGAPELKWLRRE